jgi:GAF domain-containing protein
MAIAGPRLSERDRKRFTLMVVEKKTALTEACHAMTGHATCVHQEFALSFLSSFWSPATGPMDPGSWPPTAPGRRSVVHDTRSDPLFAPPQRQAHAAVQVLGAVGVPLLKQGALVAILAVHSAAPGTGPRKR